MPLSWTGVPTLVLERDPVPPAVWTEDWTGERGCDEDTSSLLIAVLYERRLIFSLCFTMVLFIAQSQKKIFIMPRRIPVTIGAT